MGARSRILREAAKLFAERGYQATNTADIADAAELNPSELVMYFAGKAEIMNALLKVDLDAAVAAAERQRDATGSPAVRLYRYLIDDVTNACRSSFSLGGVITSQVLYELEFAGARVKSERLRDARSELIRQGVEAGEFIETNPVFAGRAIEWSIEGMLAEVGGRVVDEAEAVARQLADFSLRALLKDPESLEEIRRDADRVPGSGR